jgi:hypothetical protein
MAVKHQHALRRGRILGTGDIRQHKFGEDDRDRQQRASEVKGTSREPALPHWRPLSFSAVSCITIN